MIGFRSEDGYLTGEFKYTYLTFIANTAGSTVALTRVGSPYTITLEYSTDRGHNWTTYTEGNTITLGSVGSTVMFRGDNDNFSENYYERYHKFVMTGSIAAKGNIMSLLDKSMVKTSLPNYGFVNLFSGCASLTNAPELPATTLVEYCYQNMFYGCTNLTQAPELPATTMAEVCYSQMFYNCTSLTQAPQLPATTLAGSCYSYMFRGCTNLQSVNVSFTDWNTAQSSTNNWLQNVKSSGTFTCPSALPETRGYSGIPNNWRRVDK